MRPYLLHLCLLALLMAPGFALLAADALVFKTDGMLFTEYAAARLYWLAFLGYAAATTATVASVNILL